MASGVKLRHLRTKAKSFYMKIRTLKSNTTSVLNNFLVANDSDKILEQFKLVWKSNRANGKCFENFCP